MRKMRQMRLPRNVYENKRVNQLLPVMLLINKELVHFSGLYQFRMLLKTSKLGEICRNVYDKYALTWKEVTPAPLAGGRGRVALRRTALPATIALYSIPWEPQPSHGLPGLA